jgi:hypothetical protein
MDINQLAVTVEGLRVQGNNTATAVSKIELGMKDQDAKLDLLVADLNVRKGAGDQSKRTWGSMAGMVAVAAGVVELIEFLKGMGKH